MQLIFATNNQNKAAEIRAVLPPSFSVLTLKEAGITIDIPEPYDTLEQNAATKAQTIFRLTGLDCFSEDTGLEVAALRGEPGVRSARYAGKSADPAKNTEKLLQNLKGVSDRRARFRTVICLLLQGEEHYFEGVCEGAVAEVPSGGGGFGYDPVFIPNGAAITFAQMTIAQKSSFSHRAKAVNGLVSFLHHLE
jgi:XTP/dITP diphosphohydrolase